MEQSNVFVDILVERRKDCDISWATRPMNPLLPHKLPPESRYTREKIIEYILSNERVRHTIKKLAAANGVSIKNIEKNARCILNEMASKEDLATVRWLGIFITKAMKRIFSKIYVNECRLFSLKQQMQMSQVQYIYVPSHRSYLDFILLSYVLFSYDMALPNIASGIDFYQMKIVGELLRKTGAFYMRRSFSNDPLYKEIFRTYVNTIVSHSSRAIEFFIEGTRSRSQKSITPKYGLLSMILESLLQSDVPDIQFIPISMSYERPPEELLFVYELLGIPKPKETTTGLFRSLSILQRPFSHGRIFFNICEPISARHYVDLSLRRARMLSPHVKLPSSVSETMAYLIIDAHKKNIVFMPINIIALLLNERIQMRPSEPYTLDSLAKDYQWFKNFIVGTLGMSMHPATQTNDDNVEQEILESLEPHDEFIVFDSSNMLRLKQRHKTSKQSMNTSKVKGHVLSDTIMSVAVPAINIMIYVNPILASLVKAALITTTIGEHGTSTGEALKRYELLRMLLGAEFVFRPITDRGLVETEWKESLDVLLTENCLHARGDLILPGENRKLFFILHNVALPFIDVVCAMCALLERGEIVSSELTDRTVIVEMQKEVEKLMLTGDSCCQHPYCLSLDLYSTTLSALLSQGVIEKCPEHGTYRASESDLASLIGALRDLPLRRPVIRYVNALPSIILPSVDVQAKL
ncbi:dihydroxyacetone phosphate acyltransferase [Harpegnathos saltator]|uniref:Dihydroxyacetone phosphate acyltransferase n=1 Tax=Harpegnathos saltator TaxID=610380 RepID=E2BAK0_HARSA|nr:dihydroxyacetone phosphate acyltransferase [Harpegnathos saltator]XP_011135190.1 dihydroxyacetone phosphate acyltransferase [Harpegnathos saltator]XP_025163009.1 dihydroxyacetone phosphate acyltransferase [Harpegnathos saltator]EFN87277.1 Dihydroxyacetone phosphate acyltransferase [Harpegnathos saltator]